jgi:hypothetical protein
MYRVVAIGALIAALAAPAGAAGQRAHKPRVQSSCPQRLIFRPGRSYTMCDGKFWIRDPETGNVVAVSFWRLQHLNDPNADRP